MTTFKLIRPGKNAAEREGFLSIVLAAVLAIGVGGIAMRSGAHPLMVTAMLIVFAIWGRSWLRRLYPDWPRAKDVIGTLALGEHELVLTANGVPQQLPLAGASKAELFYNHIKGRQYAPRDIIHNGIAELKLTWRTGEQRSIKFLVEREEQLPALEVLLRKLYTKGCFVREQMGRYGFRTVLLKAGRSYAELQALKKELGVDAFH